MGFNSILGVSKWKKPKPEDIPMHRFMNDLNLDQIFQDIMDKRKFYDLRQYYYIKPEPEDIPYRMEVLKDIEQGQVYQSFIDFSFGMRRAKEFVKNINDSKKSEQKQKWKLDSAHQYIITVSKLYESLRQEALQSQGMTALLEWLKSYLESEEFNHLQQDTEHLMKQFQEMQFNLQIKRDRIIIKQGYLDEDYCKELLDTFKEDTTREHYYQANPFGTTALSALEEVILDAIKKLNVTIFQELKVFDTKYTHFINEQLNEFETEVQFYIAFYMYRKEMQEYNYHFCYPKLDEKSFVIQEGYDLALARKNTDKKKVVFNDCKLEDGEQFLVITGPNQGGKTTYARALGQILYLGRLGLMVPASYASFPKFDQLYTHFATEESMETGAGKLKEELLRLKVIMDQVTTHSFVIINEIFSSATSYDAYIMGKRVLEYFMEADCQGVYVTHIQELTKEDPRIVSMVAALLSEESNIRTFKIERKAADGRSYANTIVDKYHMTYEEIKERIKR